MVAAITEAVPLSDSALSGALSQNPMLAFDFDGTLAPIVECPREARVPSHTARILAGLCERFRVAIVTGRQVNDVAQRLGFNPWRIIGSHGGECPHEPERSQALCAALDELRAELSRRKSGMQSAGVIVEDKRQSIALHYRGAVNHVRAVEALRACVAFARSRGFRVFGGKCVVNVVPMGAPDKAEAVASLLANSGASTVVYAGDDANDEPVFAAAPEHWLTIKVGSGFGTRARTAVNDTDALAAHLGRMVENGGK